MATNKDYMKALLSKLDELPPERVVEVEDFVDFLRHREQDQYPVQGAARASQNRQWGQSQYHDVSTDCLCSGFGGRPRRLGRARRASAFSICSRKQSLPTTTS